MTGALFENGLNTLCLESFWESNKWETRWNRDVASNSYISNKAVSLPLSYLRFKTSNDLLFFMALETKDHILGAK